MELRSCEKEAASLASLYKQLYRTRVTITNDIETTAPSNALSLSDHLPPWFGPDDEDDDDDDVVVVESTDLLTTARDVASFRDRVVALRPTKERLVRRLVEKDPVTGAPRYGARTTARVRAVCDSLEAAERGAEAAERLSGTLAALVRAAGERAEAREAEARERERTRVAREEEERAAREREARERVRDEEEAARHRIASEAAAREQTRRADRAFVDSVTRGPEGVRERWRALRDSTTEEEARTALEALATLFRQIVARPEEERFRTVWRDHPDFARDVGRHEGGCGILIAAGFQLVREDMHLPEAEQRVSFVSTEPNLETDMDKWSDWFDNMKSTLSVLEEELENYEGRRSGKS